MPSQEVAKQLGLESVVATVMTASATERLCAMSLVAAVTELVTIQAHKISVMSRVMMDYLWVEAIATFADTTPRTR